MKNRFNRLSLGATGVIVLSIYGCGGGGDTAAANPPVVVTNPTIVNGVASKGPLNGASICAYNISDGNKGAIVGKCATTNANGNYSIDLGGYTGPVLFEATGGTYVDEATRAKISLASPLRSAVPNLTGSTNVAITALTELAYQIASANPGGLNTANIQSAVTSVQKNFGVPDIVGTVPVDALSIPPGATAAQKAYALSLATISQYQSGQPGGASLASGLKAIQSCLAAPTTGCGTAAANIGTLLNTATAAFVAAQPAFSSMPSPVASFGTDFISQGGLTWSPPPIGANVFTSNTFTNYQGAVDTCSNARFNGLSGWRLPTIAELSSLYASGLMNGKAIYLWSSTPTSKPDENFPGFLGLFFADNQNPKQQPPFKAGSVVSSAPDDKGWVSCVR